MQTSTGSRKMAHLDGDSHERPTGVADVAAAAAGAHIIVVRQINIEHQLALHRHEGRRRPRAWTPGREVHKMSIK